MTASPLRSIALCADDFALHPAVDEAVERLLLAGRLSATSCMTTAPLWKQAALRLPALRPRLSVGLHFNLTEGHGVQAGQGIGAVIAKAYTARLSSAALRSQWQRQLDDFEDALGIPPDFIDGHQHVHQLPAVRAALALELQERYGKAGLPMPWVRSTVPAGGLFKQPKASIIAALPFSVIMLAMCYSLMQGLKQESQHQFEYRQKLKRHPGSVNLSLLDRIGPG